MDLRNLSSILATIGGLSLGGCYGNIDNVGDDEQPLDVGPVPLF